MKIPQSLRDKMLKELEEQERYGKPNGLEGMFWYLAAQYKIYPDDIIKKYNLDQYDDWDGPDGWEGDLTNQL